jgi:2-dehydro-3-deoxygluconokinase
VLTGADWFHWAGITPALSAGAAAICLEAVQTANRLGVKVSADIFYRSNLWQWGKTPDEILPELASYTNLLIASTGNLDTIFGIRAESWTAACQTLMAQYPNIRWIADTERTSHSATHNDLRAMLWHAKQLTESPTFSIDPIVDRIGGGDAFIAGLIYGLTHHADDLPRALTFAVAASALKHTIEGDANLCSVAEVEAIAGGNISGRLRR